MYVLIIMIAVLIYFGVWLCKYNFEKGLVKVTRFRLRYTIIMLVAVGFTAYVDQLPEDRKEEKIYAVNEFITLTYSRLEILAIRSYYLVADAGDNILN
jgi:hypothetical protein